MQTTWDFAGSTDMWSTSAGGHLMKVVNLTGFTVLHLKRSVRAHRAMHNNVCMFCQKSRMLQSLYECHQGAAIETTGEIACLFSIYCYVKYSRSP